jgi:hypothetical protein
LHIVGFSLGALALSAIVVAVAYGAGFGGWAAIGLGGATFILAQALYLLWLAGMARAEAKRRKDDGAAPDAPKAKPNGVVQKG